MAQSSLSEIERTALNLIAEIPHVPASISSDIWKAIGDLHAKGLVWFRGGCWHLSRTGEALMTTVAA
jgi:hypothetical protein